MPELRLTTTIDASPARVWQALVVPAEVTAWDGVTPIDVPSGYPSPGQHARWRTRLGPLPITLHDRITAIEPERRMASSIDVAFVHVEEEYVLRATGAGTELVTTMAIRSHVPGLGWLADALTRSSTTESMARLKAHCEADG